MCRLQMRTVYSRFSGAACPRSTDRRRICDKLVHDQRLPPIWRHGNGGGDIAFRIDRSRIGVLAGALDAHPQPPSQAAIAWASVELALGHCGLVLWHFSDISRHFSYTADE